MAKNQNQNQPANVATETNPANVATETNPAPAPAETEDNELTAEKLPIVTQRHLVAFLAVFVAPYVTEGDTLTNANERKATLGIIAATVSNPFVAKCFHHALLKYGSVFKMRAAATDARGTFRSSKDKDNYLASSLLYVDGAEGLNVGSYTFTPATSAE